MNGADVRALASARRKAAWLGLVSGAAIVAAALPAAAQNADKPVGVADRPRPDYDPIGEKLGALLLQPQLKADVIHDDNVFATNSNTVSDTYVTVAPRLTLKTDWPRHSLSATASGRFSRYDKLKRQDTNEWSAGAAGRLDVTRDLNVNVNVAHDDKVEPRNSAIYVITPLKPITYTRDSGSISVGQSFNHLKVSGTVSASSYDYDASRDVIGALLDQSYRNRTETGVRARVAYGVSPMTSFFVEGGRVRHDYDHRTALGESRDSTSTSLLFGVQGEITRLVQGEASIGYAHYDFAGPSYNDVDNFNYNVQIEWYPTQLLTIGLAGTQVLEDTPLPTIPGYISKTLTLTGDYELRRNLILSGRLMAGKDDYQGGLFDHTANRYGGSLSARYLVARGVGLQFRYDHEQRNGSDVSGADFRDNTVGVGVTLAR